MEKRHPHKDNKPSVLWILLGCGLEGKTITGAPVRFFEISSRWQSIGVKQHLLTTSGGLEMLKGMGLSIPSTIVRSSIILKKEPFRQFRLWSYIISSIFVKSAIKNLCHYDYVISVSDYFPDIIGSISYKKRSGAKWLSWIHHRETHPSKRPGNIIVNTLTYNLQEWSFRRIAALSDLAQVYTTNAGDTIESRLCHFGMSKENIRRMECGINYHAISNTPSPAEKKFDACMIGVRPNKGLYDIIPIWERVLAIRPSATLLLMGGMSGESEILNEIKTKELDKNIIVFKPKNGFLSQDDYYKKIKEAKILFAPSHEEGWGIALCESLAAGVPVVAYDLEVYSRIFRDNFIKVPTFDFDQFAAKISEVLSTPTIYQKYSTLGKICASCYDWDKLAQDDLKVLTTIQ